MSLSFSGPILQHKHLVLVNNLFAQIFQQHQTFLWPISQDKHPIWDQYHNTNTFLFGANITIKVSFAGQIIQHKRFAIRFQLSFKGCPVYLKFETKHRASPIESNGGVGKLGE